MYRPAEDTFFMADIIKNYKGNFALEVGIGSGYLTRSLCSNFDFVVGTDINFDSIVYAKSTTLYNYRNKLLICTSLGSALKFKFDLIISNPPYLPNDPQGIGFEDNAIYGGKEGIEFTLQFLNSILPLIKENGKILLLRSSLSNIKKMDNLIGECFYQQRVLARKNLFFESLEIVELAGIKNSTTSDVHKN
jgi:release factor glutamine methyltransferase